MGKSLNKTSSSRVGSQGKVVDLVVNYKFAGGFVCEQCCLVELWEDLFCFEVVVERLCRLEVEKMLVSLSQKSKQTLILRHRFSRESCRSRRVLQLSLGNIGLRIKFCLEFS